MPVFIIGLLLFAVTSPSLHAGSVVITFDDLPLGDPDVDNSTEYGDTGNYFYRGAGKADPSSPIINGGVSLANDYNAQYGSFSGWAYSNTKDTTTAGFTNQFSNITGGGRESDAFGIFYNTFGAGNDIDFASALDLSSDRGMYITNTTYTYATMRDGDSFSKKMGGQSGNDPDYFLVRATGLFQGETTGTSEFYLADYRFEDNQLDYLVDEWQFWNLSGLGIIDGIQFTFEGSDVGQYGLNTPVYFAMDDFGAAIPEPRAGALLLLGLMAFCARRRRNYAKA